MFSCSKNVKRVLWTLYGWFYSLWYSFLFQFAILFLVFRFIYWLHISILKMLTDFWNFVEFATICILCHLLSKFRCPNFYALWVFNAKLQGMFEIFDSSPHSLLPALVVMVQNMLQIASIWEVNFWSMWCFHILWEGVISRHLPQKMLVFILSFIS